MLTYCTDKSGISHLRLVAQLQNYNHILSEVPVAKLPGQAFEDQLYLGDI